MQDVFYEESTSLSNEKKESLKYGIIRFGSILSYVLACFWAYLDYNFLDLSNIIYIIFVGVLPLAIFIFLGIFLGKLKDKFYVVFDYTFVTGSIRISKVIRNVKRKFIIKFECSDIEKIGKISSELFSTYYSQINCGVNYLCLTTNSEPATGKEFYYIVTNVSAQKTLLKLECSKEFIMNVIKFSKRTVIDGELLKWYI